MPSDSKASEKTPEKYEDVLKRLEEVVKRLEGANLSLEDSLDAFDEGIRLVGRGEKLLSAAEKRVEQLLANEHGEDRAVPLDVPAQSGGRAPPRSERPPEPRPQPPVESSEDDVPF